MLATTDDSLSRQIITTTPRIYEHKTRVLLTEQAQEFGKFSMFYDRDDEYAS
jgi:hypothetical protein